MSYALSEKQEVLDATHRLPDIVAIEVIIYQCYVLENIRRGRRDATGGYTQAADEMLKNIKAW